MTRITVTLEAILLMGIFAELLYALLSGWGT
jgi:hypothetical protein